MKHINLKVLASVGALLIIIMVLIAVNILSSEKNKRLFKEANESLLIYLPQILEGYRGDNGYYHIVEKIDKISEKKKEKVVLSGETKDLSNVQNNRDYSFTMTWVVDYESIQQSYIGTELNESEFDQLILLKLPLQLNNKWTFSSKNKLGEWQKITGEIIELSDDLSVIKVRHSLKNGYYEERVIQKDRGVTDFVKLVTYKNVNSWTGYHVEENEFTSSENEAEATGQMMPTEEVKISTELFNLILGFNQNWVKYIHEENENILVYIMQDSPAYEKIKAVDRVKSTDIIFKRFYPYEIENLDQQTVIKVIEIFETDSGKTLYNKVNYTFKALEGVTLIYDFEVQVEN